MLRLLSSKAQERIYTFEDHLNPVSHVGIHWIALAEHSQISTHLQGLDFGGDVGLEVRIGQSLCAHIAREMADK